MSTQNWTNEKLTLPSEVAKNFLGAPRLIPLFLGENIYRLRTNREGCLGNNILESPWWFPKETFREIVSRADKTKSPIRKIGRQILQVPKRFNEDFDTLVVFVLLRSGFAYRGQASPQTGVEGNNGRLLQADQLWIPGLQPNDVRFKFFGNIEERM
jgi:hypothetical protein